MFDAAKQEGIKLFNTLVVFKAFFAKKKKKKNNDKIQKLIFIHCFKAVPQMQIAKDANSLSN